MNPEAVAEPILTESPPAYPRLPPTQDELPCDDGVPMETERHRLQMELLIHGLKPWLDRQGKGYVGGNMFVYFSLEQVRHQDFRGPDVFVVLDVPQRERKSWVVWEEGKGPDLIIDLLSESTAGYDKSLKKEIYRERLRVPEYYWFDPFNPDERAGFRLSGNAYEPLARDAQGRLFSPCLQLTLVCWPGSYAGVQAVWLRWATPAGELLLTAEEAAAQRAETSERQLHQERQRAEQERQRAEQERRKVERLAARLRDLGIDPDEAAGG